MKKLILKEFKSIALLFAFGLATTLNAGVIDFEDVSFQGNFMPTPSADGYNDWRSGNLNTGFESSWGGYAWEGVKASKATDTSDKTYNNDCCSVIGGGAGGSSQYGVLYAYGDASTGGNKTKGYEFYFDDYVTLESMEITNTAYTYNSLSVGDAYAKSLADVEGEAHFTLFIRGINDIGNTDYMEIVLGSKNSAGAVFIMSDWTSIDLSGLGEVIGFEMYIGVSDNLCGAGGINTPTYVAFDNIKYASIPEPSTCAAAFALLAFSLVIYTRCKRSAQ